MKSVDKPLLYFVSFALSVVDSLFSLSFLRVLRDFAVKILPLHLLLLPALLLLAACATPTGSPPLPADSPSAIARVQSYVPLGTPAAQAQQILEQHKFRCKLAPSDSSSATPNNPRYLAATLSWPPGNLLQTTWNFTLKLTDGKVSAITVTITSLGPAGNYQPTVPGSGLSNAVN